MAPDHPPPTILVTGAPGNVGTPLVRGLVGLGASIRVGARDAEVARSVLAAGVEVVAFDFTDPRTFSAFDGIERLFLLRPPAIADVARVIGPALDAARGGPLERLAADLIARARVGVGTACAGAPERPIRGAAPLAAHVR